MPGVAWQFPVLAPVKFWPGSAPVVLVKGIDNEIAISVSNTIGFVKVKLQDFFSTPANSAFVVK